MGKYLGYIIIIIVHFFIKGCKYQQLEKTTGVVVDERSFQYGRSNIASARNVVPYPIAKFTGPTTRKEIKTPIYKPENLSPEERQNYQGEIFETKIIETNEYTTETPWGAYFFRRYQTGDSIKVVYDRYKPQQGIVCTFFSFWLNLRSLCFIILFSIVWTGIYNISTRKYY